MAKAVRALTSSPYGEDQLAVDPAIIAHTPNGVPILNAEVREWTLHAGMSFSVKSDYFKFEFDDGNITHQNTLVLKFKHRAEMALFKLTWNGVFPEKYEWSS